MQSWGRHRIHDCGNEIHLAAKAVWNLPLTQQGNTRSQHHWRCPYCCLQRRSEWCMSLSQTSSTAMAEAVVAGQAPHAVPSVPPDTCLGRQELGVATLLVSPPHVDCWQGRWESPAGKAAVRVGSTLFSEPISSLTGALKQLSGDYSDTSSTWAMWSFL